MKPIVTLALLLLLVLIFWFARCRPGAGGANCLDDLTELPLSGDYCDPQLVSLDYESGSYEAPPDAPQSACAQTGLGAPIWLRVRAPRSGQLVLHQYLDEPLTTAIEVFTGSCADGFSSVDCREMTGIVSSDTFKVSGSGTLLVRVQPLRRVRSTARAGSRLSLAAMDGRTNAQPCDTTRNGGRLIISSSRPRGAVQDLVENELGLPVGAVCECSPDKTLMAISVPPGVDLEILKEKADAQKTNQDTINYDFNVRETRRPLEERYRVLIQNELEGQFFSQPDPKSQTLPTGGASVTVAIVDSGVDPALADLQPYLWRNPGGGTGSCVDQFGPAGYDFRRYDDQPDDTNGHGTVVAGIILDGWPGDRRLDLLNLKFYEAEGSLYDGICAIYGAVAAEADIINLSWGFYADSIPTALKDALDYAQAKDVIIVQSAGNEGLNISSDLKWPAAYRLDNMVVVGSFIRQGFAGPARIDFSNYSTDYVHVAAPFGAQSFLLGGGGSQEWFSGTSVSAPIVARQLAQLRAQQPALPSRDLIQQLLTGSPQSPLLDTVVIDRKFLN